MKGKQLWIASLALAMVGCGVGGGCLLGAAAETQPKAGVTVGAFATDGFTLNGTQDGKTVMTTTGGSYRATVLAENVTSDMSIEVSLTADEATNLQLSLFNPTSIWTPVGTNVYAQLEAGVAWEKTVKLSDYTAITDSVLIGFYFDMDTAGAVKKVTVNKLTVGGVSYQPTPYVPEVTAPDKSFKDYTEWTGTNGIVSQNTLEKKTTADEGFENAIDHGAGNFTITDPAQPSKIEIPLYQAISNWPTTWTKLYLKVKANNLSKLRAHIESDQLCTGEEPDAHLFCDDLLGSAWNSSEKENSVSEGYIFVPVGLGTYFGDYLTKHAGASISKIVLVPVVKDTASAASVEIAGMTFGETAPKFLNDIGVTPIEIGDWAGGKHTIEKNQTLGGYTGTKVSYEYADFFNGSDPAERSVNVSVKNFDAAKTPNLHFGFYTDSPITLAVGYDWTPLTQHVTYQAGYHVAEVDFSQVTAENFPLRVWPDQNAGSFDGRKNIIIDNVTFYKESTSVALGEATKDDALFKTLVYEGGKLTFTWDAKNVDGARAVSVPVNNWHEFDRYLHLNVTLSHDAKLGVWGDNTSFVDPVLLLNDHALLAAGTYDLWFSVADAHLNKGNINSIMLYCDANNAFASELVKTLTVNKMEFCSAKTLTSSPNANVLTIDYLAGTATFAENYQVATSADFAEGSVIESGAAIAAGNVLYVRKADGSSGVTAVTLRKAVLDKNDVPAPTVGENYINFGAQGYEYKLVGVDEDWKALGTWSGLAADTEYTVCVRVRASSTSFASDPVEIKVTTKAAASSGGDGQPEEKPTGGCRSSIGVGIGAAAGMLLIGAAVVVSVRRKKN